MQLQVGGDTTINLGAKELGVAVPPVKKLLTKA